MLEWSQSTIRLSSPYARLMALEIMKTLSLTIVATNELHDFNHVLGCNYEKDLHL